MEIKNAQFFHPESPDEKFEGKVFHEEDESFLEIYDYSTLSEICFKPFINVLYVTDQETGVKHSAISLSVKSWSPSGNSIFRINEFYEGSWVPTIFEKFIKNVPYK